MDKAEKRAKLMKQVASEIKKARKEVEPKIKQGEMAKTIKSSAQHLSNLETGKYFPTIETLFEIGEATGKEIIIMFR